MAKIIVEIKNCQDCPFVKETRHWTPDSWDHAFDYYCKKVETINGPKTIAEYIEFPSEMPDVPSWCPCRLPEE